MKRLLLATAAALTLAPAAFAMSSADAQLLSNIDRAEIQRLFPTVNLANLPNDIKGQLANVLASDDTNKVAQIRALLN
jgi:hypothetical protein